MFGPPREGLAPGHGRDVTVWASFVKLWMRELSGPLIPSDGHYDQAIKLAGDNLARARASGTAAGTPVRRTASGVQRRWSAFEREMFGYSKGPHHITKIQKLRKRPESRCKNSAQHYPPRPTHPCLPSTALGGTAA